MPADIVLTWLLNATPDPQRGTRLDGDVSLLAVLRDSVHRHGRHLVVLHDCLGEKGDAQTTFVAVPSGGNPYFHRWRVTADYLTAHPEIERVWTVDGTDVEMLHDPFPHMAPGVVYCGSDPTSLSGTPEAAWLATHCPSTRTWQQRHKALTMLNVGTIGGDRATVLDIATQLAAAEVDGDAWEMGAFQRLMYEQHPDHVTGPMVHTVLRANDRNSPAWWRHK
jgi:hypothetical protein